MTLPRRGGPGGRYQSWLRLSKKHKQLRKLIPIYFPANSIPSSTSDEGNGSSSFERRSPTIAGISDQKNSQESQLDPLILKQSNGTRISTKVSYVWNIDEFATHRLHDDMDPRLIYQSLNVSPIHWKCVPQLRGLNGKHCAALCGVIIRKRQKKPKRVADGLMFAHKQHTHENLNGMSNLQHFSESATPKKSKTSSPPGISAVTEVTSPSREANSHPTKQRSSTRKSSNEPFSKATEDVPGPCRFCCYSIRSADKQAHMACVSCSTFLRAFSRTCRTLEDFVCLRDIPCSSQWPVPWIPPDDSENRENITSLMQFGPISERWCDPCKVLHCVKLGCKLTDYCGTRSLGFATLRSFALDSISSPEFCHRTRERRVQSYLDTLTQNFSRLDAPIVGQGDVKETVSGPIPFDRFLDLLWVRPLHLPSLQRLHSLRQPTLSKTGQSGEPATNSGLQNPPPDLVQPCAMCALNLIRSASWTLPLHGDHALNLLRNSKYSISLGPRHSNGKKGNEKQVLETEPVKSAHSELMATAKPTDEVRDVHEYHGISVESVGCPLDNDSPEKMGVENVTKEDQSPSVAQPLVNSNVESTSSCQALPREHVVSVANPPTPPGHSFAIEDTPLDDHKSLSLSNLQTAAVISPTPLVDTDTSHHIVPTVVSESESVGEILPPTSSTGFESPQLSHSTNVFEGHSHQPVFIKDVPKNDAERNSESNLSSELCVCGPCLLQLRHVAACQLKQLNAAYPDPLSALLRNPEIFCLKRNTEHIQLCPDTELCDRCFVYRCLSFVYDKLCNHLVASHSTALDDAMILPVGGPLLLPTGSSEGTTAKSLYGSLVDSETDEGLASSSTKVCFCCHCESERLNYYNSETGHLVCSGCLWTYKAALLSIKSNPSVFKVAQRLAAAAAAATDSSIPLISKSSRQTILDMACLAHLFVSPCTHYSETEPTEAQPLWLRCRSCLVRRCFRLLPVSLPIHPPLWFRRRSKLFQMAESLADLDPRVAWLHSKRTKSSRSIKMGSLKPKDKLKIVDVEYTSSLLEGWLLPPNSLDRPGSSHSDSFSDEVPTTFSDDDSGFSLRSSTFAPSDHSSEYGELGWWDTADERPTLGARLADKDSSATEPETDAIRADELSIPVACKVRRRKVSGKDSGSVNTAAISKEGSQDEGLVSPSHVEDSETAGLQKPPRNSESILEESSLQKRRPQISEDLIVRGKRQLKLNPRFLDDYDGTVLGLAGSGRRARRHSGISATCSQNSRNATAASRKLVQSSARLSSLSRKATHARYKHQNSSHAVCEPSDESSDSSHTSSHVGPRVKQISRPTIKQEDHPHASTLSAMVHAARLAAVGAKIPGGTSPNHAALAATARTNESNDRRRSAVDPTSIAGTNHSRPRSLPDRCGKCPACCGLIQACGRCRNCRLLQQSSRTSNAQPCTELICFRRRPTQPHSRCGPRVKLPSNFSGMSDTHPSQKSSNQSRSPEVGPPLEPVSLMDTVPGLAQQLDHGTWLTPSNATSASSPMPDSRDYFKSDRRQDVLNVHSDVKVTPIPGGDLGLRFAPSQEHDADQDRIRPVEGEVVNTELSHQGGYAVVTTMAAAPPKELCYSCGSGGGHLLFCVSCAEPFHFYCVERQFRPRRKDHFICRNCSDCRRCHQPAADLRCVRCSRGYHPHCLPDYAPAQSTQRGNWTCPWCTSCIHCGVRPVIRPSENAATSQPTAADFSANMVAWSKDPNKCAACSTAEAHGDMCPECDRAYLSSAKQMIQCDTCQLWLHRTCAKLTVDEYEYIARLPLGKLNKIVVNCTVCQRERKQRDETDESTDSALNKNSGCEGVDQLRSMAKDTLMERMTSLASQCRRSGDSNLLPSRASDSQQVSPDSPDHASSGLPQLDGVFDNDATDPFIQSDLSRYFPDRLHMIPTSDGLLTDQVDPSGTSSPCSFNSDFMPRPNPESERKCTQKSCVPAVTLPPIGSAWIMEKECSDLWTSPRFLLYRVLTRILHRLSSLAITSSPAVNLRRLLRWLSSTTESLFPWLTLSELANDVREVLRQAQGNYETVLVHFEKCAIMEMHELLCPVVARQVNLSLQVHSTSSSSPSIRPWVKVAAVSKCFSAVMQHLRSHHASLLILNDPIPEALSSFRQLLTAKSAVASSGPSQCSRPHEIEVSERMRNETREERWIEHWSTMEEHSVLRNFQRHLQRKYDRIVREAHTHTITNSDDLPHATVSESELGLTTERDEQSAAPTQEEREIGGDSPAQSVPSTTMQAGDPATEQSGFYFASDEFAYCDKVKPNRTSNDINSNCRDDIGRGVQSEEDTSSDDDTRPCLLCGGHGDNSIEGRLLFTGADTWIHINCALWSNEVYEEETGQLIGLSAALHRARMTKCVDCGRFGATLLCSNTHEAMCTLYNEPYSIPDDSDCFMLSRSSTKAVHFACALRRRPPTPKSIFTADRSWFCSPACHQSAMKQRLVEAIKTWRERRRNRSDRVEFHVGDDEHVLADLANKEDYSMLETSVADDLEPISLGELLVFRRVFVPSDCFAASLLPSYFDPPTYCVKDSPELLDAMRQAIKNLNVSPNSFTILNGSGLPASALVVTVGSLRVDRLGQVREASDALATENGISTASRRQNNFLCPINYRARRIYWSCHNIDERVSYTLHVKQMHAVNYAVPSDSVDARPTKTTVSPVPSVSLNSIDWMYTKALPCAPVAENQMASSAPSTSSHQSAECSSVMSMHSSSEVLSSFSEKGFTQSRIETNFTHSVSPSNQKETSLRVVHHKLVPPAIAHPTNAFRSPLGQSTRFHHFQTSQPSQAAPVHLAPRPIAPAQNSSLRIVRPFSLTQNPQTNPSPGILLRQLTQRPIPIAPAPCVTKNYVNSTVSRISSTSIQGASIAARTTATQSARTTAPLGPRNKMHRIPIIRRATPTKDPHLATQLNGIFQNVVQRESPVRTPVISIRNTSSVGPMVGPPASVTIRIRAPRLLPQVDGTMDSEDDTWASSSAKRSRPNGSSSSIRRRLDSTSSSHELSTRFASESTKQPAKRRWIEERSRQQELAQLVSKAKLANHARMYQHEIEKHARLFKLRFVVSGIVRAAATPTSAWRHVLSRVTALREKHGLPALLNSSVDGWAQFGLSHRHIVFLIEQMRGAFHCYRYSFRYHWKKIEDLRQKFTPPIPVTEGCARAIPWTKPRPSNHARDPLSFLSCKSNPPPRPLINATVNSHSMSFRDGIQSGEPITLLSPNEQKVCAEAAREAASLVATQLKLPVRVREACIAQAVVQATGLPLNTLKARSGQNDSGDLDTSLDNSMGADDTDETDLGTITTQFKRMVSGHMARYLRVAVHPSRIHGRGLFALRGFREDEMVIEYLGELIRNFICETRELRYRAAGVDCYMFRVDQDSVIDATYAGNAARFINHSCQPNCYAKVITVEDKKHIIILAQRRIYPGEELTYDYRFPKESDKLLCNCGSFSCRKYLN